MNTKSTPLWRVVLDKLRNSNRLFTVKPFELYAVQVKGIDLEKLFEQDPIGFYKLVKEYFRGDEEATYFFLDYIITQLLPGEYELSNRLISAMSVGDEITARRILEYVRTKVLSSHGAK